uniref:Uncharacterized protein n=1 Tax=Sphaerodactylus townsendi TaxID=933632 RepID=A0ACB8EG36_9SAUR
MLCLGRGRDALHPGLKWKALCWSVIRHRLPSLWYPEARCGLEQPARVSRAAWHQYAKSLHPAVSKEMASAELAQETKASEAEDAEREKTLDLLVPGQASPLSNDQDDCAAATGSENEEENPVVLASLSRGFRRSDMRML